MAYGMDSYRFCCCLPVRLGVFVLSFLQILSSGFVAAVNCYVIAQGRLNKSDNLGIATIITAVVSTILLVVSLLGFIGSLLRRLPLVRIYSKTLNWMFALNLIGGIVSIVLLLVTSGNSIKDACTGGSTDQDVIDICDNANVYKYTMIGWIVLNWAVHLYECIIVARYALQLQEEKEEKWRLSAMKTYMQEPRRDSTDAFTSPPVTYPYADKQHSYSHDEESLLSEKERHAAEEA